jgi:hypothetical protein
VVESAVAFLDHRQSVRIAMSVEVIESRLDSLMEEVVALDSATLRKIREAWNEIDESHRLAAWDRVKRSLERTGRNSQMNETRERVRAWVSDLPSGAGLWNVFPGLDRRHKNTMATRLAAAPAVLDAAAAVIVGDTLDESDLAVLEGPFRMRKT